MLWALLSLLALLLPSPMPRGPKQPRRGPATATLLSENLLKPANDHRHYRLLELSNQMRVLLISDPEMEDEEETAAGGGSAMEEEEGEEEDGEDGEEGEEGSGSDDEDEEEDEEGEEGEEEEGEDGAGGAGGGGSAGKKAAVAICVGVGYLCDPRHAGSNGVPIDGLAHFVEHMLFMGTAAYPTENEWSKFLAERGGEDNGETDAETTTCFFDVNPR
jgi:nardilysin